MDAVTKLWQDSYECCSIYDTIVMPPPQTAAEVVADDSQEEDELVGTELMNPSQITAIRSSLAPLSLIWGPPGKCSSFLDSRLEAHSCRNWKDDGRRPDTSLSLAQVSGVQDPHDSLYTQW